MNCEGARGSDCACETNTVYNHDASMDMPLENITLRTSLARQRLLRSCRWYLAGSIGSASGA